jgi:hypothetical protein
MSSHEPLDAYRVQWSRREGFYIGIQKIVARLAQIASTTKAAPSWATYAI